MVADSKRPGSRLAIVVIVLLAVSAAVIAMWRVSTTSTVQEAPYFPPGHIQIASNQQASNPASRANEAGAGAPESAPAVSSRTSEVTESAPSGGQPEPATANTSALPLQPSEASSSAPTALALETPSRSVDGGNQVARPGGGQPSDLRNIPPPITKPQVANNAESRVKASTEPSLSDVRESVEQWRTRWESRQAASYVEFYHPRFPGLTAFARQKNNVMGRAEFIEVKVTELKISLEAGFTRAQFKQHYKSNTYESFDIKTQHWVMTNSGPRIIEETTRSLER